MSSTGPADDVAAQPLPGGTPVASTPPTIAVVGVHGHGRTHLRNALRLEAQGRARLAAVVDPRSLDEADLAWLERDLGTHGAVPDVAAALARLAEVPHHGDLAALLATRPPSVVVLSTPIHTHHDLAVEALRAGCDVLLEKPPTASLTELDQLLAVEAASAGTVQVGFQTFGSGALDRIAEVLASGRLGEVTAVEALGTWVRPVGYWTRSAWAGRRTLGGRAVVDGVVTNPLAHAVATALRIAGARTTDDVASVELDQYRVNDIEADDTSVVRVRTADGVPVTAALTLCAATHELPTVTVRGTRGHLVLDYYADAVEVVTDAGTERLAADRTDLLEDLLRHRAAGTPLLSPLREAGAFTRVLDAVRTAPDPRPVDPAHVDRVTDDAGTHLVLRGVEEWCRRAVREGRTFAELGAPWATTSASRAADPSTATVAPRDRAVPDPPVKTPPWDPRPERGEHGTLLRVQLGSTEVARYVDGTGSPAFDSPRPHLHPVTTCRGTVVTAASPADHTWHLGLGIGVQDVAGHNLWGGRTYLRDGGYTWRRDHGRIEHRTWTTRTPGTVRHRLAWLGSGGEELLREERELAWSVLDDGAWRLDLTFTLTVPDDVPDCPDVPLGSPGSNGREAGGYGGAFWRLADCDDVDVRTPVGRGEEAVHGSVPADGAAWLAWSATARSGDDFTIAVVPGDARTAKDPWFVRAAGYPGIGSALAWDRPLVVRRGHPERRALTWVIADGRWEDGRVASAVEGMLDDGEVRG
ncbi:DUF6807 family protein [Cellulomonas sp. APG4]|uniref:DUF6807 family protein n=1 Tax=Cellulomonas sp. APG4 TaxID=1538656 RepID=UPI00351AE809